MAHDYMRSYEVGPRDMKINKERRQSRGKSRQRYQEHLEEQNKQKDLKRNFVGDNQRHLKEKKVFDCNY